MTKRSPFLDRHHDEIRADLPALAPHELKQHLENEREHPQRRHELLVDIGSEIAARIPPRVNAVLHELPAMTEPALHAALAAEQAGENHPELVAHIEHEIAARAAGTPRHDPHAELREQVKAEILAELRGGGEGR